MELNKTTYRLSELTPQQLRELLRNETRKEPSAMDPDFARALLRELAQRPRDPEPTDDEAVEAACESFRRENAPAKGKRKWYQSTMMKVASILLAAGILLSALPRTAEAENLVDILTRWTESAFHFFAPGEVPEASQEYVFQTDHPGLQEIYDAVTELGVTTPVVPTWVPDGFELYEIEVFDFTDDKMLCAGLEQNEKFIYISIIVHDEEVKHQHEKDIQDVKTIDIMGVEHYVISNNSEYIVTWWADGVECSVATDCQEEEIHKLLISIYTPED